MNYKKIYLKKGKEASLQRFHPWIFSGAVAKKDLDLQDGDIAEVYDCEGKFAAVGHYQQGSIMLRILSFRKEEINIDFFKRRLLKAYEARKDMGLDYNDNQNCFRLVHGEGDFLPGLIIDFYASTAVMQAHSVGMHIQRGMICDALTELFADKIDSVYYKSENTLSSLPEDEESDCYLAGNGAGHEAAAVENGLKFAIDWERGQKTGFFIDQRENRKLLEHYSKGKNVLNLFCYSGGFSCYALRGGAALVHSVDSSARAISLANKNVEANFGGCPRHRSYVADAFEFLQQSEKGMYDVIVLDPPAFAKRRSALNNALQGYKRLNAKALEKIKPGGLLFTFSCSQAVDKNQFRLAVFSAAVISGRKVRILHQLTQPSDHPINICHPEGEYLKGLVLYVE